MKTILALALAATGLSTVSEANPQSYRIDWYQASDADCPSHAQDIARRFTATTGRTVLAATCERPFSWKLDVVIQYDAPGELRVISTSDEHAMAEGTYASKAACEADLGDEIELFKDKTGLSPVVSFCLPESSLSEANHFPYVARIDAFGTPRLRPFTYDYAFYKKAGVTREALEARLESTLALVSTVEAPRLRVDYAYEGGRMVAKYYAKRQMPLAAEYFVSFETMQRCEAARPGFESLMKTFGVDGLASFCGQERFASGASLYYFGFTTGFYSVETAVDRFDDRDSCEAALIGIEERFVTTTGSTRVKALCSYERLDVWSNPVYLPKVLVAR